jgi:hypothetical protein
VRVNVLLVGLKESVVDGVRQQIDLADVELHLALDIDGVRDTFAEVPIDHVVMGAGLDLDTRLAIVREIYALSDRTTVHMKDRASGPDGFLPFVRSVVACRG